MSKPKDGGAAFPVGYHPEGNDADQAGMSLRDYFAGQALAGFISDPSLPLKEPEHFAHVAASCYALADAMIAERERAK